MKTNTFGRHFTGYIIKQFCHRQHSVRIHSHKPAMTITILYISQPQDRTQPVLRVYTFTTAQSTTKITHAAFTLSTIRIMITSVITKELYWVAYAPYRRKLFQPVYTGVIAYTKQTDRYVHTIIFFPIILTSQTHARRTLRLEYVIIYFRTVDVLRIVSNNARSIAIIWS